VQRKTLSLSTSAPKLPQPGKFKRSRNEFKAWLIFELSKRGAQFGTDRPSYAALRDAIEQFGIGGKP